MALASDSGVLRTYDKADDSASLTFERKDQTTTITVLYGKDSGQSAATKTPAAATNSRASAASTPERPTLTDASVLPTELKTVPIMAGFAVIEGSTQRIAEGGVFQRATARLFGPSSVSDVEGFYNQSLASAWSQDVADSSENTSFLTYTNKQDGTRSLSVEIEKTDGGTRVTETLTSDSYFQ